MPPSYLFASSNTQILPNKGKPGMRPAGDPPLSCLAATLDHLPISASPKAWETNLYKFLVSSVICFFLIPFYDSTTILCHVSHLHRLNSVNGRGKKGHMQEATLSSQLLNLTLSQEKLVLPGRWATHYKVREPPTSSPNLPPRQAHVSVTSTQKPLSDSPSFSTMENHLAMVWQAQMEPPAARALSSCWL